MTSTSPERDLKRGGLMKHVSMLRQKLLLGVERAAGHAALLFNDVECLAYGGACGDHIVDDQHFVSYGRANDRAALAMCFRFLATAAVAILVIAAADLAWQRAQFFRRQRMSLKELRDESKETEGDPHTKQARRQKAYDIATNQMLLEVPGADVVVVNPEHFAVALKWARTPGS